MGNRELNSAKKAISTVLREKFGSEGRSLAGQLRKAKRNLPHKAHKDARVVVEGEAALKNPILRKRVDKSALKSAKRRFLRRTDKIDLKKDRTRKTYYFLSDIVIKLLICACLAFCAVYFLA